MTTATKYKTYSKYKPSGADWLGNIPDNWEAKRLRYFFDYHAGGVWGDEEKGDQNDLICLRVADFDFDHFGLSDTDLTTRNIPENQHSRILEKGDILLEKSGGGEKQTVGRAVRFDSNDRVVCSNFIEKLTPLKAHNSKYISYLMGALYFGTINVRSIKQTTGIQNLDIYAYFSEVVPFPEKAIQKSIADFLDHETTKIDEMVVKKQKMIDLLKEKRQALITHAVTKGLDPKAKMKSSGIDWLGDIPAGWEVKALKRITRIFGRIGFRGYTIDDIVDYGEGAVSLSPSNIKDDYFDLEDLTFISWEKYEESPEIKIYKDDLVFVKTGSTIGKVALADNDQFKMTLNPQLVVFKKINANSKYLYYLMASKFFKYQVFSGIVGGSTPALNQEKIGAFKILLPKQPEQKEIVDFLESETAKIDEMMKKVEMQIEKLQQYRQALITSAVTGKIII